MSRLSDSRVLVTGASGFLGRRVVQRLSRVTREPVISPEHSAYDLTTPIDVACMMARYRPDVVIHLAATCGGIGANRAEPGRFFYDNMMMGMNVIHSAWEHGVKKVVTVGTVCAYPENTEVPFREDTIWDGYPESTNAPYGVAKRALLTMGQAYRKQYGLNTIFLLPANLYGPGDNFDLKTSHVIPALIRKFVEAKRSGAEEVVLWGDGSPTREFLYVDDAAAGIVVAAEDYNSPDPVNLGTGRETSICDLTALIATFVGYEGRFRWDMTQPNGQRRRRLDVRRAKALFAWTATTSFETGLRRTIDWYVKERGV